MRFKLSGKMEYLRHSESDKDEVFHNLLRPTAEEHFSDLGAYNGGHPSASCCTTRTASLRPLPPLEPDRRSFRKLNEWASANITGDVTLVQAGAWNEDTVKCFTDQAGRQSRVAGQRDADACARQRAVRAARAPISKWTWGRRARSHRRRRENHSAVRTQAEHLPITAVRDFFQLPLLIHALQPSYRLYLRHHPLCSGVGYEFVRNIKTIGNPGRAVV